LKIKAFSIQYSPYSLQKPSAMRIFISHSWNDKSLATQIKETLEKDGHEVWYDIHQLIPGDNIQAVIDIYIKKCEAVVLPWSIHAFDSDGVDAEIRTAKKLNKRIIPLQVDATPLNDCKELKGLLSIPFDDTDTGMLLLQRGLLMLMAAENYKDAAWFKECFDNVVDLGGYLNYTNTYRLKLNKNDDGCKEEWVKRLEELKTRNEYIRQQLMPQVQDKMARLQGIMKELEHGNVAFEKLKEWQQWCEENESFHPELMNKLKEFIGNDIKRLGNGGVPVSILNTAGVEKSIERLDKAITQKKDAAYQDLFARIKKYGGLFLSEKLIDNIISGYLKYVTMCPQVLRELLNEAKLTEYVAVKETTVKLIEFLEGQDHGLEIRKNNLEGYFDDAYIINNTVQLLIKADLIAKNNISLDFVSANVVDKYVSFILNKQTKSRLDQVLTEIRNLIGLKKNEINWGQVAAVVLSTSAIVSGVPYFPGQQNANAITGNSNAGTANENTSPYFEDRMAAMSAKYGGGLNVNFPVQY
jgi:GTP:adenosylcobinamide-phosphate guanylyltransferase